MFPEPYILTKMDVAALRKADFLHVSYRAKDQTNVRATKQNKPTPADPFARDIDHMIAAPVIVHYSYNRDISQARCDALVWLYPEQLHHATCVLATLRAGDGIVFDFYPDAHSNGYMEEASLHGDSLYLLVYRNGKQIANWEVQTSLAPSNTARMCRDVFKRAADSVQ